MFCPKDIKKWVLLNSFNSEIKRNKKERIGCSYYIAANLSQSVLDYILSLNTPLVESTYIGAILEIQTFTEESGFTDSYTIMSFFSAKNEEGDGGYLIGFTETALNNTTYDYKSFLKSCNYINIDVPVENLNNNLQFTQGIRQGNILLSNTAITFPEFEKTALSQVDILEPNVRTRYASQVFESFVGFTVSPIFIYPKISITPSVCNFASSLCKKIKTVNGKCKTHKKTCGSN